MVPLETTVVASGEPQEHVFRWEERQTSAGEPVADQFKGGSTRDMRRGFRLQTMRRIDPNGWNESTPKINNGHLVSEIRLA